MAEKKRLEEEEHDFKLLMQKFKMPKPGDGIFFGSSVKRNLTSVIPNNKTPNKKTP